MGLIVPVPNRFNGIITNLTGQPTTTWGTSIADGTANAYGTYTECIPNTAYDTYYMQIEVAAIGAAGADGSGLLTIGIDHSGGTTYTNVEINHLIVSCAGTRAMGAHHYEFPLYIPAGSAVAAKLQTTVGTISACIVGIRLYGKPTKPELVRAGTFVKTYGAVTATSQGTAITPGTTTEGTVVTLASNVSDNVWWWQGGMGTKDTTMSGGGLYMVLDVGVGTSTSAVDWIFQNQPWAAYNTSEQAGSRQLPHHEYIYEIESDGVWDVYARSQGSGAPDTGITAIAYALGG